MKLRKLPLTIILNLFLLILSAIQVKSQTPLKIMPLGNSITWDDRNPDTRPDGDKVAYRYRLYQLLMADGYTFNFIGSENSGGNYLPSGYADNAGFPGISASQLLTLLQTGRNNYLGGVCELPSCPQNYLTYYQPDIILLHIGTNGLFDSTSVPGIVSSISSILDLIDTYEISAGKTVPVFLAQIINRGGSSSSGNHQPTSYFNQQLAIMIASRPSDIIRLVNMETGAGIDYRVSPTGDMYQDLYHPVTSGYNKMGTMWYTALEQYNYTAPIISTIPNQSVSEGSSFSTINLNDYVYDPQESDANITWTSSSPANLNVSISSGKIATITVKNSEWNGSESVTFTAYDSGNGGTPKSAAKSVTFTVTAVNDAPVLSGLESSAINYTEGLGNVNITSLLTVSDVDNTTLGSATVTISGGFVSTEDQLNFTNQNGISGMWNPSNGTLTLSGTSLLANYQSALRSITYINTNQNNPSTTARTLSFAVNDGSSDSNIPTRTINISGVNDAPTLSNIEVSISNYLEDQGSVNVTSTINVGDVDNTTISSASVRISSGYLNSEDILHFTNQNGISGSWSSGLGTLTLTGSSSLTNYQNALRSITYENTNTSSPNTTNRVVTFSVNDGSLPSNVATRTITVTSVNDPSVLAGIETSTITYTEGDGQIGVTSAITITDIDNTNISGATVNISTGYSSTEDYLRFINQNGITGNYSNTTGRLILNGSASLANYRTALRSIKYENINTTNPSTIGRTVRFRVYDGSDSSNVVTRNIAINGTNNAPSLSGIESGSLSYTEGQSPVLITSSIIVQDVDNTNLVSATISISGFISAEDRLYFSPQNGISGSYTPSTGILSLTGTSSLASYQTALRSITYQNINNDNPNVSLRSISFLVNDGTSPSNGVSRALTISAVNDAPVLGNLESSTLSYTEEDVPKVITNSITVNDVDNLTLAGATIHISSNYMAGEDTLRFVNQNGITGSWNGSTGTLTLVGTVALLTYQTALKSVTYQNTNKLNPSTLARTVSFTVNDGITNSSPVTRDITIIPVNDPPVLGNIESTAINFTEGTIPISLTSALTVTDYDSPNLNAAYVNISSGYVSSEDVLSCNNQNGINVSWSSGTGILTLTGSSTVVNYQTALRSVTYSNSNGNKPSITPRIISFIVNDGNAPSNILYRNLTITGVNDPPVLSGIEGAPITYTEGDLPVIITSDLVVADVDNDSLVSATISIDLNPALKEDTLRYPAKIANITGTYNPATFTMTLSGKDKISNYQLAIRSIKYENRDTLDPSTALRRISINVNDGLASATTPAYRYISITPVNDPPTAKNVILSGTKTIFSLNTLNYTYSDPDNNSEGASIYTWKRAGNPGVDSTLFKTVIGNGGNSIYREYVLQYADGGYYIRASVQPADVLGAISPIKYCSPWYYVNAAPVAKNVKIGGTIAIGQTDTINFTYSDKEDNPKGTHKYFWYRANNLPDTINKILIASTQTYAITAADNSKYISCAVAPVALLGSLIGDTIQTGWYGPISILPSATISGTDTICPGELAKVKIALTGTSPWSVTYKISSGIPIVIPKIVGSDTTLLTNKLGTYILTKVSDAKFNNGVVNGSAIINQHDSVKVILSAIGDTSICNDGITTAHLRAGFTGVNPWHFTLSLNTTDTIYTNITQNPFNFTTSKPGLYHIKSTGDKFCTSLTGSKDTIKVSYKISPEATISGIDSICPGDTASLTVTLTKGTLPWSFTYTINNVNQPLVNGITKNSYTLKVTNQGTYKVTLVSDALCTGKATGQGVVIYRSAPTAMLLGGGTVCEGSNATLRADLTGISPWYFSYKRGSAIIDTIKNITASPKTFNVNNAGTYSLAMVHDKYCKGTVSGSVTVSVIPAPSVDIIGLNQTYSVEDNSKVPIFGSPAGGTFSGDGLFFGMDTTFFLPRYAGTEGSPHKITYRYQDPSSGCFGKDSVLVNVLNVEADIVFPDDITFYCYNSPPFTITGANIVGAIGTFTISGGIGLTDNGDNTALIEPSKLSGQVYEITYTYLKDGTPLSKKENITIEYVNPIWFVGFNKNIFCNNEQAIELNGNVAEGIFYGKEVTGNIITGFYFVPSYGTSGIDSIFYSYTTLKGCSRKVYEIVTLNEAPQIDFDVTDTCVAPGLNDSTAFINKTISSDGVTNWAWNFDDPNSVAENTSTLKDPTHLYKTSGRRYVILSATSTKGCVGSKEIRFNFGDKPHADFDWISECYNPGSTIAFNDNSSIKEGEINSYKWKFYTGDNYDSLLVQNPEFSFQDAGDYKINLEIKSNYGCVDTTSKIFHLRPTFKLAESDYMEDFETGPNGWVALKDDQSEINSWQLGQPTEGFNGAASGVNAWYTGITKNMAENSWISSPCFDFTDVKKPMIKFDMWRIFDQIRDGAVLQYRINNEATWHNIGGIDDGINWFNKYDIQGQPGRQAIGWSDIKDTKWGEARHNLNMLIGQTNVQFRVAYGSDGTGSTNKGIAIDNIGIWERGKIVLLEHFTNSSDSASKDADDQVWSAINKLNGDVMDIQYHTSFPGSDPFNLDNPLVSSTRVFYYGILGVPFTFLDGGVTTTYGGTAVTHKYDYNIKSLADHTNDINLQSLTDPKFSIEINSRIQNNTMNVNATLIATQALSPRELTLHIIIIERKITTVEGTNGEKIFRNVVKTMLPNTAGTYIYKSWSPGSMETVNYSWNLNNVFDADELRAVAFVQDESTKEIYQAAIDKFDFPSGINEDFTTSQEFKCIVYPNPASDMAYIRLNQPVQHDLTLSVYDVSGRLIDTKRIEPNTEDISLETYTYEKGIFFIRISDYKKINQILKLIVNR